MLLSTIPSQHTINGKCFLVTGGAGFIGSHIVSYLLNNAAEEVRVLDNLSTGSEQNLEEFKHHPSFKLIIGDITNYKTCEEACAKVDGVFHNAALGSVSRSITDPLATNEANVNGFLNMLQAAKTQKVKKFIYASSSSVYGDDKSEEKREPITGNLLSPYAVSKKTNELYADVFYKTYGLSVIGLRYFNVYGPKQNPYGQYAAVIPIFISNILTGKPVSIFGDGSTSRDFTYIDNVIHANILAYCVENEEAFNQIYNVAYGASTSLNQLYNLISTKLKVNTVPEYKDERKGDIKNSLANIGKAKQLLKYEPLINLQEGLERTVNWYKSHLIKS